IAISAARRSSVMAGARSARPASAPARASASAARSMSRTGGAGGADRVAVTGGAPAHAASATTASESEAAPRPLTAFRTRARGRRLEVVAFPPALVEHLPPQPGLLVLDTHRGSHRLPEDRRDAIALRRACRQQLQDVCERHREPPERAAPRARRTPGRRIGPALALALVPGVAQQTGALVARPLGDEGDLPRDVVESRGLGPRGRNLGVERAGH